MNPPQISGEVGSWIVSVLEKSRLTYWRPLDYLPVLTHDVQQPVGRSGRSYRHEHEDLNEVQLLIVRQQRQKSSRRKRRPVVGG